MSPRTTHSRVGSGLFFPDAPKAVGTLTCLPAGRSERRGLLHLYVYGIVPYMVVRMRHTRAHTANRRSHHALKEKTLATCECGAVRVSHRACSSCGRYRGRVVVDLVAKTQAKAKKKAAKAGSKSEAGK